MKISVFKKIEVLTALVIGLMLFNPVIVRAEGSELNATVAENAGTAYIDNYMNDEVLTSASRAVAAEYFGIDSKDVQLLADFGVSFSEDATLPASVTISGIFDKSYTWSAKDGITLFSVDDTGYTDKVSYIYADGDIRFTVNSAGHFFVAKDSGDNLRQTELKSKVNGYTITANGNMPKGAVLKVKRVYKTAQLEEIIGDEDYQICAAFDIEILVDGQVWQPVEHGESVSIDITGVDIPEDQELKVYRIEDEAVEAGEAVSGDSVIELDATLSDDGNVVVETDHFTVYTVGGVEYNLAPMATGTWLGMTYETFDSDGDGTAETLVLSGTQTAIVSNSSINAGYYVNAPYYQNDITTVSFQNGTKLIDGSRLFYGCNNLIKIDATNADVSNCTTFYRMFYDCSGLTSLDVNSFDTSKGTDFNNMFYNCSSLTSLDVSNFNTSNGTDFSFMFYKCKKLASLDLSNFNTSSGINFYSMFCYCYALTSLDISGFNTSKGEEFGYMFGSCTGLTSLDVSGFNTSSGTSFANMFFGCSALTSLDVSGFNTSSGTSFANMFSGCSALTSLDVSGFNTSSGTSFYGMFNNCKGLTSLDVSEFDTSKSEDFGKMFGSCQKLASLDVSGFDTTNGTDFSYMFYECSGLTSLDVSGFDTSNGTNFSRMFYNCSGLTSLGVSGFNTSNSTNFSFMFTKCNALTSLDVSGFDTSSGTDFRGMFTNCSGLTDLDLSSFDTSSVTSLTYMLTINDLNNLQSFTAPKTNSYNIALPAKTDCAWYLDDAEPKLEADAKTTYTSIIIPTTDQPHTYIRSDIEGFLLPPVATGTWLGMTYKTFDLDSDGTAETLILSGTQTKSASFESYESNYYGKAPYYRNDITTISFQSGTKLINGRHLFRGCSNLTTIDATNADTSSCTDFGWMFNGCSSLTSLDVNGFDTSNGTDFSYMFYGCGALTSLDVSNFNTSNGTNFTYMFYNCKKLTSIGALSNWVVSNGTSFAYMFYNCNVLISVGDLSNWNVSNSTNFSHMFEGCRKLTSIGNLSNWNVSNATNFSYMFSNCNDLTSLDLSGFNTSSGTSFANMFYYCESLTSLDVSGFDTSKGTDFDYMFCGCESLTSLDVSGFNTSNSEYFNYMFSECRGLTSLDVSKFNTSKGINFKAMFYNCQKITNLDVSKFDTSNGTNFSWMFNSCSRLTSLDLSGFNTSSGTDFNRMFYGCGYLTSLDLSNFDTSKGTDFSDMFYNCYALASLDVSGFDTSSVTSSSNMFRINALRYLKRFSAPKTNSYNITLPEKTFSAWYLDDAEPKLEADTKTKYTSVITPVTDQPHVYIESDIEGFSLPILEAYLISGPEWRTALYELAGNSYSETSGFINYNLQTETSDGSDVIENTITDIIWTENAFNTTTDPSAICVSTSEGVPVYARMSTKDGKIVVELYTEADVVYLNSNSRSMFQCYDALETISFLTDKIDASRVTNAFYMFAMGYLNKKGALTPSLPQIKRLDLSRCTFENTTTFNQMFYNCNRLAYLDIHNFETTNGTDFGWMFQGCGISSLDLSKFNTSSGTNFRGMFESCTNLTSLDINSFNTSKGTNFSYMFYNCSKLTSLDVSGFDTSSGTNFGYMFSGCSGLTNLDVSSFDTSNGTLFYSMFDGCSGLASLDLSSFDTSKGTDFHSMFSFCSGLISLDVSGFDTSSGTNFGYMFSGCSGLTNLDVSSFNTSKGTDFGYMFDGCSGLTSLNIRNFTFSDNAILDGMFAECDNLSTIYGLTDVTSLGDHMFMTSAISWTILVPYINDNYAGDFDAFWESVGSSAPYSYDEAKAMYESAKSQGNSLTVLYFADYEDFTSDCWFNYDWAADGRSVCIYDVSIPAVATGLELSTEGTADPAGTLDVSVEKYVSDEDVTFTTPSALKLTSTTDSEGYLTYMFTQDDTSKAYSSLKDEIFTLSDSNTVHTDSGVTENATGPKYSVKEKYTMSVFKGQDQNLKGRNYTGNIVISYGLTN